MEFSKQALGHYFSHKLGRPCDMTYVEKFGRGSSRETWFVTLRHGENAEQRLVLRRDPPTGSVDFTPLSKEHRIYSCLGRSRVPVASALWWEDDPAWTDRPFYVREHIDGSWQVPHFKDPAPMYDDLRIRISQEHMRKLALVHAVDWKALGLDAVLCTAPSEEEAARNYVESIETIFEQERIEAIPLFLEAAEWLKKNAPVAAGICLCKGTNGLGEEIFDGEEIVAMSDWEEAHIGDPAADFAFMQEFAPVVKRDGEIIWGLEQAIDYYRSVGGAPVSLASVQYYQVARALRMLTFSHRAAANTHRSADTPIRHAWTGTEVQHFCKRILAATLGLSSPPDPSYLAELNTSVENAT